MTDMETWIPEQILMFPKSHLPQTGPPRSYRKHCLACPQGMTGEELLLAAR